MRFLARLGLGWALLVVSFSGDSTGQTPAKPKFDPAKVTKPDAAMLDQIAAKTRELRESIHKAAITDAEVLIYLKAAESIVKFGEWFHADSGKWTLKVLDTGLKRATESAKGHRPWNDNVGRWVVRSYRSKIDGSIQPYAVMVPPQFLMNKKPSRLDVVLHGRDASLTEVKFLNSHDGAKEGPKELDGVQLEVYGRGNNAYRWAGETDVWEAIEDFNTSGRKLWGFTPVDANRMVLRGFSMGGAGTWHIGLHHPSRFAVIGPGAGFTTTRGYIVNLPATLPEPIEKCLHIYDAVDYAENAFNVPIVAYSGEKDPQKAAADKIEMALKGITLPLRFQHMIAPGLEHKQPPEWQAKLETQYRKFTDPGRATPERIRFVTYTPAYGQCDWLTVAALEKQYERAEVDATRHGEQLTATVKNVRVLNLQMGQAKKLSVNGRDVPVTRPNMKVTLQQGVVSNTAIRKTIKDTRRPGPIDDAFRGPFVVRKPVSAGWHAGNDRFLTATQRDFATLWDRYFRGGPLPDGLQPTSNSTEVLFGDPKNQPRIRELLPRLPITWTEDQLIVNGVTYDPKTHLPKLIFPHPEGGLWRYLVLNSGHSFQESDLKGTNALLYPRLGDWAVVKVLPNDKQDSSHEVVALGLFDENWQFVK